MNETPATGAYMVAAYVVTAVVLLGYLISLLRRTGGREDEGRRKGGEM